MLKYLSLIMLFVAIILSESESQEIEKLEVTGSYIKRTDVEGPNSMSMIDQDDMLNSGSITISDVLKQSAEFEAVYEGVGHVRFRGQNAGSVLILLNGMRLPKLDGGYYTSISSLPASVVDRVEMLKDGGAALYGSDAMSGVMNFKTRKNLHGGEISISSVLPENGKGAKGSYVASFGHSYNRGNLMGVVQYETTKPYMEHDIGSYNQDLILGKVSPTTQSFGEINSVKFGPLCTGGTVCETDPLNFYEVRPKSNDLTTLLSGRYDFNQMKLSLLGMYNRREREAMRQTQSVNWSGPAVNNDTVKGRFIDELGVHKTEDLIQSYNLQTSLDGYMGDSWNWQIQTGYSMLKSESQVVSGEANVDKLKEFYRTGVFVPGGTSGDFSSALIKPTYRNVGDMLSTKAVFSGELFHLSDWYQGGGVVSMALGAEAQFESFEFKHDKELTDGTTIANPSNNFKGERDVYSAFMEVQAYPIENMEVQLAHRFDRYTDVGNTYNPKISASYKLNHAWLFRSSLGTSFRAPGMTDIYSTEHTQSQNFTDQNCNTGCKANYDVTTYSDKDNVKPEESVNYSFGAVYAPTKNISFTIDQWNFRGKDTLSAIKPEAFTNFEKNFGASALSSVGVDIQRDAISGQLLSIRIPRVSNMGRRILRGVDFGGEVNFGIMKFSNNFSYIFTRDTTQFSFTPVDRARNTWKNNFNISLSYQKNYIRVGALTVSPTEVGSGDRKTRLGSYSEFDFTYSYTGFWKGKLNVTVKNLANTRPPVRLDDKFIRYADTDRQYSSFSPLRRSFFVAYSQQF